MFFVFGNDGGFVLSFTCTCSTCVQVYMNVHIHHLLPLVHGTVY